MFKLLDVSKSWSGEHGFELTVPELIIRQGEKVALVGFSGCGKSTLLDLLAMILQPDRAEEFLFISDAENRGIPVYALRANTAAQMESFLMNLFELSEDEADPVALAMLETEDAIGRILGGQAASVDLAPQNSFVRRYQHEMVRNANLGSRSHGKEPYRNVRIYRED